MKKIINYLDIKMNKFFSSSKLMIIVLIFLLVCLIYILIDLYCIHLESIKVQAEIEKLNKC
jgi:hypothetical protein